MSTIFDVPGLLSIMEDESDTNLTFYPMLKIANVLSGYQQGMMLGELIPGRTQYDTLGAYWAVDHEKTDVMFGRIFKLQMPEKQAEVQAAPAPQATPAGGQSAATETKKEN